MGAYAPFFTAKNKYNKYTAINKMKYKRTEKI